MTPESLMEAVRVLPSGDYAEVGVYQGDFAVKIAAFMNPEAKLWLFDSLKGHEQPGEHDRPECHPQGRYADTSYGQIMSRINGRRAELVAGYVPETLDCVRGRLFRFVHIDVDHYRPTKAAIEFFVQRLVPGGAIWFDDWMCGDTPGATLAIQEFFGEKAARYYRFEEVQFTSQGETK